jgi:arylsulfatase A
MLTRRQWLASAGVAALPARPRRNVVLIMSDDQGYGDLGCHGNPIIQTPRLDRLASESIEFTRFYVSPVCAPTRASLLTGRYPFRCGTHGVTAGRETMRAGETTIAELLRAAGYRTGLFGKWHLGEHYPYVPHGQGFDEFVGFRTGHWINYWDTTLERNGRPLPTRGFLADVLTGEAVRFIERNRARPFFLYLAHNLPHSPLQVPEKFLEAYRAADLPERTRAIYAMVSALDANVGRLLDRIDALGLRDDTAVVFLGDNGPNGQRYNAGLRGTKAALDEGGVRVPFFARVPGVKAAKVERIAAHIDVLPTVLDWCGLKPPSGLDGRSVLPLIQGATHWPDRMLFTHGLPGKDGVPGATGAVRTDRWLLVNADQLYDIPEDPGQKRNLAPRHPETVRELRRAYEKSLEDVLGGRTLGAPPIPVGHPEENPVHLPPPQARLEGGLAYYGKAGWAHDWITNWRETSDAAYWEIDVARAGAFQVALRYLCATAGTGSRVRVTAGGASVEGTIVEATPMDPRPSRDVIPRTETPEMHWKLLPLGSLKLPAGRTRLTVQAVSRKGAAVMDLGGVDLAKP